MSKINDVLIRNRLNNRRSLTVYLNCGDPSLEITTALIKLCAENGVDIIELGVPFANSFTDGETVLKSHERALRNHITFEDTIAMVKAIRIECAIPIVLLADFSYTVKSRGIKHVVEQCSLCGIDGLLMHGLPPLYQADYIKQATHFGIDPIFSLYPNTSFEKMLTTLENAKGFVYLVSQYGRSGSPIDFNSIGISSFYSSVRHATDLPLLAGFGIKNIGDMNTIFSTSEIDGVIMGSSISKIIELALPSNEKIIHDTAEYLQSIAPAKTVTFNAHRREEETYEYAS